MRGGRRGESEGEGEEGKVREGRRGKVRGRKEKEGKGREEIEKDMIKGGKKRERERGRKREGRTRRDVKVLQVLLIYSLSPSPTHISSCQSPSIAYLEHGLQVKWETDSHIGPTSTGEVTRSGSLKPNMT